MEAEKILKGHRLKNTGCRKFIISQLLNCGSTAMSEPEIKQGLPNIFDRVTFYRSLKTLEENNIVHRVVLHDATVKYALNKDAFSEKNHAHFYCNRCEHVTCVEMQADVSVTLPQGFKAQSTQVLIEGLCPVCVQAK